MQKYVDKELNGKEIVVIYRNEKNGVNFTATVEIYSKTEKRIISSANSVTGFPKKIVAEREAAKKLLERLNKLPNSGGQKKKGKNQSPNQPTTNPNPAPKAQPVKKPNPKKKGAPAPANQPATNPNPAPKAQPVKKPNSKKKGALANQPTTNPNPAPKAQPKQRQVNSTGKKKA